jgi:hypothetical protein
MDNSAKLMGLLALVQQAGGHLEPEVMADQARGHFHFPQLDPEQADQMKQDLEWLAETDYLDKVFFDRLTLCPSCSSHQVNVREICTSCKSSHLSSQPLLHHFRCGYVGTIDNFPRDGQGRQCPKCHGRLADLGTDHDMPGENFVCHACHSSFQMPETEGLCLSCGTRTPAAELLHQDIYSYRLNSRGLAALNNGRLFDTEETLLMEGAGRPIYRRHVFLFLLEDEKVRALRYGSGFGLIMLRMPSDDEDDMESLAFSMADSLRSSDKIGRYDERHLMVLLPETDSPSAAIWLKRFLARPESKDLRAVVVELNLGEDLPPQLKSGVERVAS